MLSFSYKVEPTLEKPMMLPLHWGFLKGQLLLLDWLILSLQLTFSDKLTQGHSSIHLLHLVTSLPSETGLSHIYCFFPQNVCKIGREKEGGGGAVIVSIFTNNSFNLTKLVVQKQRDLSVKGERWTGGKKPWRMETRCPPNTFKHRQEKPFACMWILIT